SFELRRHPGSSDSRGPHESRLSAAAMRRRSAGGSAQPLHRSLASDPLPISHSETAIDAGGMPSGSKPARPPSLTILFACLPLILQDDLRIPLQYRQLDAFHGAAAQSLAIILIFPG